MAMYILSHLLRLYWQFLLTGSWIMQVTLMYWQRFDGIRITIERWECGVDLSVHVCVWVCVCIGAHDCHWKTNTALSVSTRSNKVDTFSPKIFSANLLCAIDQGHLSRKSCLSYLHIADVRLCKKLFIHFSFCKFREIYFYLMS